MTVHSETDRAEAIRNVLRFTVRNWRGEKRLVGTIAGAITLATLADIFIPYFAGRLVDAIARSGREAAASEALVALAAMAGLGLAFIALRHVAWVAVVPMTLRIMQRTAQNGFARVQHFSADWHANSFSGSVVRQITRGMWSLDLLHDTLLLALWPSAVVLVGTVVLLGVQWPLMGLVMALGSALYVHATVILSVRYVAPASRVSNRLDTRVGGVLADALACNAVVKAFGAEAREEARLEGALGDWRRETRSTWMRHTYAGTIQTAILWVIRVSIAAAALWLWWRGQASPGDVTYVLTIYFVVHGYLRDIGMHVNNLQRSVNEMEELVDLHDEMPDIVDAPDARPIAVTRSEIRFESVRFHYGGHERALYEDLSVRIPAGQRVSLVGHSGSGKTTFVN